MSYDISLTDPYSGKIIELDRKHNLKGGTYVLGGTNRLELNVTYNYGKHYYRVIGERGIRTLYGLNGEESIPILAAAIIKLNDDATDNYWEGTEGNARAALVDLLNMALMAPKGIWQGD